MACFMKQAAKVNTPLVAIAYRLAVYFKQYFHAWPLMRRFSTIRLARGPYEYFARKGCKLADSYAADHGVAFPYLLNTTHETVPPFFKNKSHSTEMARGTCPMIATSYR